MPTLTKLDDDTLPAFVAGRGVGLVLFGSHNGKPTLAQSHVFAELWANRSAQMRFGYIDALCHEAAKKDYAVRLLPTILVVRDGRVTAKLEGFHSLERLEAALAPPVSEVARAA